MKYTIETFGKPCELSKEEYSELCSVIGEKLKIKLVGLG